MFPIRLINNANISYNYCFVVGLYDNYVPETLLGVCGFGSLALFGSFLVVDSYFLSWVKTEGEI